MATSDNGVLVSMIGAISGRLDRIEARIDRMADDVSAIREAQAKTEERLEQGSKTFQAHDFRLAQLEELAEHVRQHCAIRRDAAQRARERWRRIGIIASIIGTWAALLGRALGVW